MRKLKLLLAAGALLLGAGQTWAQTDVTSTSITNADFSSTDGWTAYVSTQFKDYGNGLIGTYGVRTAEGQGVSTVDDTHLATEYCFGFEVRWSGNYASYNQGTAELPVGAYTLTFDVENTNSKTTKATYNNLFYVQVGETKYTDSSTEWMNGKSSWTTHTISFNITEASTATISLGYGTGSNNYGSANTPTLHVSHLKLTWTDPLEAAKNALQAEIDKAKLCDAKEGLADAITAAESALTTATTGSELEAALAALQAADKDAVLRYENNLADATASAPVATNFVVNGTFNNGIDPWQRTGGFQNNQTANNQAGAFTGNYYENWNGSAKANKMFQTITNIPNGTYRLDIAAFVNTLVADPNESQYVFANNDKVYLTTGDPTAYEVYTVVTDNKIEVGLEQTTATANWMGIDNVSLRYYGAGDVINDAKNAAEKVAIVEELKALLAEAEALVTKYANNNGTGVFQIPATAYNEFSENVANAKQYNNDAAIAYATVDDLKIAKAGVVAAIAAFKATELNAPAEDKLYNLVVATENHPKIGNAVIIIPGATSNNNLTGYGMNANFAINPNLNQAVTFTKVNGNNYNISFTTAGGTTYLTYGTLNGSAAGWKDSQIQATTDAEKKGEFLIAASATANAFNIINTITNSTIACQTGGNIYTENGNADFKLVEAATPSITINTNAAGWGTVMLPFDGLEVPANVKAYTCAATEGATLTLEEVSALEVNKPYIIEGAWEATITDFKAQGAALEYTEGLLTGVYSMGTVPSGKYVMQKKNDKVAFYKVGDNQPTINPNHAYLNAPSGNAREAFFFFDDETTGIQAIDALMNGDATIFDASGAQMPSLKKGMNIIRRADGSTYKVIVK